MTEKRSKLLCSRVQRQKVSCNMEDFNNWKAANQPKNIALSVSDKHRDDYREWRAIDQLLKAMDVATTDDIEHVDNDTNGSSQFFIIICGQQIAFRLGGVQLEGLCEFIKSIAAENFYDVDFEQSAVTDIDYDW